MIEKSALESARATAQAKIDNALDAMPPGARGRTEIDVQVPIVALRILLEATTSLTDAECGALDRIKAEVDKAEEGKYSRILRGKILAILEET